MQRVDKRVQRRIQLLARLCDAILGVELVLAEQVHDRGAPILGRTARVSEYAKQREAQPRAHPRDGGLHDAKIAVGQQVVKGAQRLLRGAVDCVSRRVRRWV